MSRELGIMPLRGHFDVAAIESWLLAQRYAERDRIDPRAILVGITRERIEYVHEQRAKEQRFGYNIGVVWVGSEGISMLAEWQNPTLRRFVEWLRTKYALRWEDDDYGGEIDRDVAEDLDRLLGPLPEPDPRAFVAEGAPLPLGCTLDQGRFVITRELWGTPDRGLYAGFDTEYGNEKDVLVTLGAPQKKDLATVRAELEDVACSGEIVFLGDLEHAGEGRYTGLVQTVPPRFTARELAPGRVDRAIALELAARTTRSAWDLRTGMRPELLYVRHEDEYDGDDDAQMSPLVRWFHFHSGVEPRCYGVPPVFDTWYLAPEVLADPRCATEASDVFTTCAMLAEWVTGEHPFAGDGASANVFAIASNQRRPFRGPADVGALVDRGLDPDPAKRPSRDELLAGLERLRR